MLSGVPTVDSVHEVELMAIGGPVGLALLDLFLSGLFSVLQFDVLYQLARAMEAEVPVSLVPKRKSTALVVLAAGKRLVSV